MDSARVNFVELWEEVTWEGAESKSYEKDGFVFCEDDDGNIIEIQILNLEALSKLKATA